MTNQNSILPCAPILLNAENMRSAKNLLGNLTPENIQEFVNNYTQDSYQSAAGPYPFGINRTPPVYADYWQRDGHEPCCDVLCLQGSDGKFTLITRPIHPLLVLYLGNGTLPAAAMLMRLGDTLQTVYKDAAGDSASVFSLIDLAVKDIKPFMEARLAEVMAVQNHNKSHQEGCATCPKGNLSIFNTPPGFHTRGFHIG
jgi:hypothetical protein